jgi:uncharacterized membrane protein
MATSFLKQGTSMKIIPSVVAGIVAAIIATYFLDTTAIITLITWVTFSGVFCVLSIHSFFVVPASTIGKKCEEEDLSTWLLFVLVVITCLSALISVSVLILDRSEWEIPDWVGIVLFILTVMLAWVLVHLAFTFRYAHIYYASEKSHFKQHANGLEFPGDTKPDYFDFAYFSFTIGMTFQVSDVVIKSKALRRLSLVHALLSFVFNTVIIALTINEIMNLKG